MQAHGVFPWATGTAGTALGVLALVVIAAFVRNPRTWSDVAGEFLFSEALPEGVVTVRLTVISQILGLVLGFLLALAARSRNRWHAW